MEYAVGIDIGGTKTNIGLVNKNGDLTNFKTFATNAENPVKLKNDLIKHIDMIIKENKKKKISGIGLASAGRIDYEQKKVVYATSNLIGWANIPITKILQDRFQLPVIIDNDVNAALICYLSLNPSAAKQNTIFLTIGTGLGGAISYQGKIIRGSSGSTGEFGHMILYPEGKSCNCGKKGCAEQYISGTAYRNMLREKFEKSNTKYDENDLTPAIMQERILKGKKPYYDTLKEMTINLAYLLESIKNSFDYDLCVLGGSFSVYEDIILEILNEQFLSYSNKYQPKPRFLFTEQGNKAGVIGGGLLIFERY